MGATCTQIPVTFPDPAPSAPRYCPGRGVPGRPSSVLGFWSHGGKENTACATGLHGRQSETRGGWMQHCPGIAPSPALSEAQLESSTWPQLSPPLPLSSWKVIAFLLNMHLARPGAWNGRGGCTGLEKPRSRRLESCSRVGPRRGHSPTAPRTMPTGALIPSGKKKRVRGEQRQMPACSERDLCGCRELTV